MSVGALTYRGLADLILTYGRSPGLGRTAEYAGVEVVLRRQSATAPLVVEVGRQLGVDLLKGFDLTRAQVLLPDGRLFTGAVQAISPQGDHFELSPVSHCDTGE